jgi:hypothetical protein
MRAEVTARGRCTRGTVYLAGDGATDEDIVEALRALPGAYAKWIREREKEANEIGPEFADRAKEHLARCRDAARRIEAGIALLERDGHALTSFKLMNAAMLRQQRHVRLRRKLDGEWRALPTKYESEAGAHGYWRIFQIAFILMTIAGLVPDADRAERELVDLIWFPTGGGKTEAYLGLAAFTLFRRRLGDRNDGGCAILMRYTLRLLTSQQFQRAASLVCACELLRRTMPGKLGTEPFTIGLWVGGTLTPNSEAEAIVAVNKLAKEDDANNPFQLLACPWCGTELNNRRRLGYVHEAKRVIFRCPANASELVLSRPRVPRESRSGPGLAQPGRVSRLRVAARDQLRDRKPVAGSAVYRRPRTRTEGAAGALSKLLG